jgi:hypothetical protein
MRTRVVEPEILDQLDPEDPEAIRNRKEIDGINRWMGNYKWILKAFRMVVRENESVIEIGAGGDRLAGRILDSGSETTITGYRCVDVIPAPKDLDPRVDWVQSDVTQFDGSQNASVLISNFFIHQLKDAEIMDLGERLLPHLDTIIINEPLRSRLHFFLSYIAFIVFGYGRVTRTDGRISIRAGFSSQELPELLGLSSEAWNWKVTHSTLGSYRLLARRLR